jgi:hypothetical protein
MHSYALLLLSLLSALIAGAGLWKQSAFSINAAGGQSALLSMLCLSGNPVRRDSSQRCAGNICLEQICMVAAHVMQLIAVLPATYTAAMFDNSCSDCTNVGCM